MKKLSLSASAVGLCVLFLAGAFPLHAFANTDVQSEINKLESRINEQEALVKQQQRMLNAQSEEIAQQKKLIDSLAKAGTKKWNTTASPAKERAAQAPQQRTESTASLTPPMAPQSDENERPRVEALADQGGVLSPKGSLTFENTMEYTNTTRNLFAFNGVELAQVVLVGGITATSARHQIVQETGRLRLGLTDKLEVDIHAPFVYRNDNLTNTVTSSGAIQTTTLEGANLGDIDAGLAYQLNNGKHGWPFLIGNLRYKANNADGPFDIPYNANNVATRLPTGTGFQTVEASVTAIKVSDPAVLFGNIGYVYDVPRDINRNFSGVYVGRVSPGDAVNALVGMGFAINQDTSFSLGYKHSFVFPTIQRTIAGSVASDVSSGSSQVGALTFGVSYAVAPATSVNFNVEAGVTNDAPDVHVIVRVPFHLGNLF